MYLRLTSSYLSGDSVLWDGGTARGLEVRSSGGDGVWKEVTIGETNAIISAANPDLQVGGRYLYFNIDDAFAFDLYDKAVVLSVTYRDAGCSSFLVEYDSSNPSEGIYEGAFRPNGNVEIKNSGQWKTAKFTLPECRFMNRCNGADFRLAILGGELTVSKVALVK